MTTILITGPTGSGKTAISQALQKRLNAALVDSDSDLELGQWVSKNTGQLVMRSAAPGQEWFLEHEYRWNPDALRAIFEQYQRVPYLIVCGIAPNTLALSSRFKLRFYVSASDQTVAQRIRMRSRLPGHEHEFGNTAAGLKIALDYKKVLDEVVKQYDLEPIDNEGALANTVELLYNRIVLS